MACVSRKRANTGESGASGSRGSGRGGGDLGRGADPVWVGGKRQLFAERDHTETCRCGCFLNECDSGSGFPGGADRVGDWKRREDVLEIWVIVIVRIVPLLLLLAVLVVEMVRRACTVL